MVDKNKTAIMCILDRSGSMSSICDDAIGGFNSFIEDQKKQPGEAVVTVILFDDQYDVLYKNKPLKDVPTLTRETFVPRGSTALYDAMGKSIVTLGEELNKMADNDRPGTVIVTIITDGQENASREYNLTKIKEMIKEQKEKYSWNFMFLCADEATLAESVTWGIPKNLSTCFVADGIGSKSSYQAYSCTVSAMRRGIDPSTMNLAETYNEIDAEARS